ncbi:MAG TPA: T9SS type A sorting domain-containing protein [Candidatus Kapabacteria bacterium]
MKTLFSLLLLAVFATASLAQDIRVINRVDKQSDQRWNHEVSSSVMATGATDNSTPVPLDKERSLQTPANSDLSFSIHFPSQVIEFDAGTIGNIKAHLVNNTDDTLHLVFRRWQTLPNGWNSSVCFGDLCYLYFVDSLPWGGLEYYEFPPRAEAEFKLAVSAPDGASDSMAAYIQIQAINTNNEDSVGFFLAAKAHVPLAAVGTSDPKPNFNIQSVYPSPLVSGSSLKVKLTAPDNAGYSYTIFDNLGREVAFGSTRQQLMVGENTVEISSLDGLLTGSYLLRIKFNGGGSDAIPFQVIR